MLLSTLVLCWPRLSSHLWHFKFVYRPLHPTHLARWAAQLDHSIIEALRDFLPASWFRDLARSLRRLSDACNHPIMYSPFRSA